MAESGGAHDVEAIFTILPDRCPIITLAASLVHRKVAVRLTAIVPFHCSSEMSQTGTLIGPLMPPTVVTRMSSRPQVSSAAAMTVLAHSVREVLAVTEAASTPCA